MNIIVGDKVKHFLLEKTGIVTYITRSYSLFLKDYIYYCCVRWSNNTKSAIKGHYLVKLKRELTYEI